MVSRGRKTRPRDRLCLTATAAFGIVTGDHIHRMMICRCQRGEARHGCHSRQQCSQQKLCSNQFHDGPFNARAFAQRERGFQTPRHTVSARDVLRHKQCGWMATNPVAGSRGSKMATAAHAMLAAMTRGGKKSVPTKKCAIVNRSSARRIAAHQKSVRGSAAICVTFESIVWCRKPSVPPKTRRGSRNTKLRHSARILTIE
jgi:hypothetical protein